MSGLVVIVSNFALKFSLLAFGCAIATSASSVEINQFAGREVQIKEKGFQKALVVDGKELHVNQYINLESVFALENTLIIVGSSSDADNACDSAIFVLSIPFFGSPLFDGPQNSCSSISHEVNGSKILFSSSKVPGRDVERWEWTVDGGIKSLGVTHFQPDRNAVEGWLKMRSRR